MFVLFNTHITLYTFNYIYINIIYIYVIVPLIQVFWWCCWDFPFSMFSNPLKSTECQLSFPWAESGSQGCAGEIVKPMSQGFDPLAKEAVPVCRLCWWCHSEDVRRLTVLRLRLTEIHFQGQTTVLRTGKSCNSQLYELNRAGSGWTAYKCCHVVIGSDRLPDTSVPRKRRPSGKLSKTQIAPA